MGKTSISARVAVGVVALALAVTACGGASNEDPPAPQQRDGERPEPKTTRQPKANTPSGIAVLLEVPGQAGANQIAFYDPKRGTPTDILRLPSFEREIERFVLAPDGRLAALEKGLPRTLHFFEPDLDAGQYVATGSIKAERTYSKGAPLFQDIVLGPDDKTVFVEAYVGGRTVVFSTPLGGRTLTEKAKLPKLTDSAAPEDQVWPREWRPWQPLADGTIGAITEQGRKSVQDGRWTHQTWTAGNGKVFAAAALAPDRNGGARDLSGFFSIAQTGAHRFIGRYDSHLAYGEYDHLLANLDVDPGNGKVEVTPLLDPPAGHGNDRTKTVLDPDRKRAAVYFKSGRTGGLYVADLSAGASSPRELDLAQAPTIDVLGWI